MGRPLSLTAYLALSARARGFADRKLAKRLAAGKEDPERIDERRGVASVPRPDGNLVWFHAASVGESLSILEVIRLLREARDGLSILVTTGTVTSAALLAERLPSGVIHQFVPLDARPFVESFLDHWRPDLAVWVESEIWPCLIVETKARGTPMVLLNARMSQSSFRRWRFLRGAAKALLESFDSVQAQNEETRSFLQELGVPKDKIAVTGTLKEGASALPCDKAEHTRLGDLLGTRPRWCAASTHEGEEEIVSDAHRLLQKLSHRLLLILVPRHPERGDALAAMLRDRGLTVAQRSQGEPLGLETEVYLADTLGEMGLWFRLAPVTFMGASFVPKGGHNPFEPAAIGSAIVSGPHVENFRDVFARLQAAEAATIVQDAEGLSTAVNGLLSPEKAAAMAHNAWGVASDGAQVTGQAVDLLLAHLEPGS